MEMNFKEFRDVVKARFDSMHSNGNTLFTVNVNKDEVWNTYLDSFAPKHNQIFRVRRHHDCSCCRNFIKNLANVVIINSNYEIETLWDFDLKEDPDNIVFQPVVDALSALIKKEIIESVYLFNMNKVGNEYDLEMDDTKKNILFRWEHFYAEIPKELVYAGGIKDRLGTVRNDKNTMATTLLSSLKVINSSSIDLVLSLIKDDNLARGESYRHIIEKFKEIKERFEDLNGDASKERNFAWKVSQEELSRNPEICKIKNTSIGTLLLDLSEGKDADKAVRAFEYIVSGSNYQRKKPVFSERMVKEQKELLQSKGYMESLGRRFAKLDDISVRDILYCNMDAASRMRDSEDVFGSLTDLAVTKNGTKSGINSELLKSAKEMGIAEFMENILPKLSSIEAYVDGKHTKNLCSIIAPENREAKSMFKWENPFSWAYAGNIAASDIKENVKSNGGKVDVPLRFSIQWNDKSEQYGHNGDDLDAHCMESSGEHIYFQNDTSTDTFGNLDVDIQNPHIGKAAVENIAFPRLDKLKGKTFDFSVHNFANRGGKGGFRAEIEFDGQVFNYEFTGLHANKDFVNVARVAVDQHGNMTIIHHLEPTNGYSAGGEMWGVKVREFTPVTVVMHSPNYWSLNDGVQGVGNKHYMFMLKDCVNTEQPNGFYNEFIQSDLLLHKGVFEALGSKLAVVPAEDQLSGLGFASGVRDDLILRVSSRDGELNNKLIKINF